MNYKNIVFVCSPNLGILDNWLPFFESIKNDKEKKFTIFFPKITTINQLNESDLNFKLANSIFSKAVTIDHENNIIEFNSLTNCHSNISNLKIISTLKNYTLKILKREGTPFDNFFLKLSFKLKNLLKKKFRFLKKENFFNEETILVLDAMETQKKYFKPFLKNIKNLKKISSFHGSDFPMESEFKLKPTEISNTLFLLFSNSPFEKEFYQKRLILDKTCNFFVSGNPKHDLSWINKIFKFTESDYKKKFGNYVFLISRPAIKEYHPLDRKKKSLEIIKKNILDYGINVVIKLHPKEDKYNGKMLYFDIFGKKNYNKTWFFSNEHHYLLGKNSIFAISLFSSVAVDLINIKIPTIEILDLKDLVEENRKNIFFENNLPVFNIRFLKLVLGSSDENTFIENRDKIMKNKDQVVDSIYLNYQNLFGKNVDILKNLTNYLKQEKIL